MNKGQFVGLAAAALLLFHRANRVASARDLLGGCARGAGLDDVRDIERAALRGDAAVLGAILLALAPEDAEREMKEAARILLHPDDSSGEAPRALRDLATVVGKLVGAKCVDVHLIPPDAAVGVEALGSALVWTKCVDVRLIPPDAAVGVEALGSALVWTAGHALVRADILRLRLALDCRDADCPMHADTELARHRFVAACAAAGDGAPVENLERRLEDGGVIDHPPDPDYPRA